MNTTLQTTNLEAMFLEFMEQSNSINQSLMASNQNALKIATDTQNQVVGLGRVINSVLKTQEEQMCEIQGLKDKFEIHMANEMITPAQEKLIKKEIYKRVCKFLQPDDVEWVLYSKAYFGNMYAFLRKEHYMMNPISCTRAKNYDDVMGGVISWYPNETEIKDKADRRRKARKQAEQL